jgi:hypothetical protein
VRVLGWRKPGTRNESNLYGWEAGGSVWLAAPSTDLEGVFTGPGVRSWFLAEEFTG